jgi:hypothetical protein
MIRADSPYETCHELFAEYHLAAKTIDRSGLVRSMVLLLPDGDSARFFMLVADQTKGRTAFSLFAWRTEGRVDVRLDGGAVPDVFAAALARGVPIPRDGSLFGWARGEAVTTLIGVQARYTPTSPVPSWAVMPLADSSVSEWPPFTRDRFLGPWFWEDYRAGAIVPLDGLIARTSGLVFWVDTKDTLGSDCCAVARDITNAEGYTLRRGRYVYYEVLLGGKPVPPLAQLLAEPGKTDLGPRFQLVGAERQQDTG